MKRKILLIIVITIMLSSSIVFAAKSMYKGYETVAILWQGKKIEVNKNDVPPLIMDNRTLIPVYMLKELDINAIYQNGQIHLSKKENRFQKNVRILLDYHHVFIDGLKEIDSKTLLVISKLEDSSGALEEISKTKKTLDDYAQDNDTMRSLDKMTWIRDKSYILYDIPLFVEQYNKALDFLINYLSSKSNHDFEQFFKIRDEALYLLSTIESAYVRQLSDSLQLIN